MTPKLKRLLTSGAFVEFLPGKEGLVHISELDTKRVNKTEDIVQLGDMVRVKLIGFDRFGKVKLSRKALLQGDGSAVTSGPCNSDKTA